MLGQLTALRDQLTEALRHINVPGPGGELPGDVVLLAVDRPQDQMKAGDTVTIRYAGNNGTVDVEPAEDYVFVTVPWADLERLAEA